MMNTPMLALIVARPGRIRDGWRALLRASSQLDVVDQADDRQSALRKIAELRPVLLLVDADLPGDEARTVLRQIKSRWPHIRCIFVINHGEQRQLGNENGADAVLSRGFSTSALADTIEELLPPTERAAADR